MFLRCTGGNADVLGVLQEDAIRNITGTVGNGFYGEYLYMTCSGAFTVGHGNSKYTGDAWTQAGMAIGINASLVVPTADENRPLNYSVNYCIIYE